LAEPFTNSVALSTDLKASVHSISTQPLADLTFNTSSGSFRGSAINPATREPVSFSGVVLQNENVGAGFFSGKNETGSMLLFSLH